MKASLRIRAAAALASAVMTFILFEMVVSLARPAAEPVTLVACARVVHQHAAAGVFATLPCQGIGQA